MKDPKVLEFFNACPPEIQKRLKQLRELIFSVGNGIDPIGTVEETLKWGEPSYATISGSPIRLGWKSKDPQRFAMYFHCQTKLVSTFRILYPDTFSFEGNRAIVFRVEEPFPEKELTGCIELAHSYHRRKNLPLLGARQEPS